MQGAMTGTAKGDEIGMHFMAEASVAAVMEMPTPQGPSRSTDHTARFCPVARFPVLDPTLSVVKPLGTLHVVAVGGAEAKTFDGPSQPWAWTTHRGSNCLRQLCKWRLRLSIDRAAVAARPDGPSTAAA